MMASSQSSLPRNDRQGKYLKRKIDPKSSNPISSLLLMQHEEQEKFLREISFQDNQPSVTLFNDKQIKDIKRFCTNACVDMTFNMGNFYVVVTTYRHLQLKSRTEKEPVMVGPVMICTKKNTTELSTIFPKDGVRVPSIKK